MDKVSGKRILVTGASGVCAYPVAAELAKSNEVYAVARFSEPEQKRRIEAAGARAIAFDLAQHDLSPLPKSVDIVINYAVLPPFHKDVYEVNIGGTGRLASRYRDCEAFVHGSSGSAYGWTGHALREDDPYGLHSSTEPYAASKIGAEYMLKQLCLEFGMPTVLLRIFSWYGPRGGGVTARVDQVAAGQPVNIYPGVPSYYSPMYEDDFVEKTVDAIKLAKVPAEIVNVAGTELITMHEYCEIAGEMLGKKPIFVENGRAWPIWADTTKMVELLGPSKVSTREGIRRILELGPSARLQANHHIIGKPTAEAAD
jgi:nucleoside-diphosphate-sugar epimerase